MDSVAQSLEVVQKQLEHANLKYKITMTRPTRNLSNLDEDLLCVIRQQVDTDGVYHLVVAAKMGSEKC